MTDPTVPAAAGTTQAAPPAAAPPAPQSARVKLAQAALGAALATEGVAGAHAGRLGLVATQAGLERVAGVTAAATGEGRYALDLHLVARPVPLYPLADRVRERVLRSVAVLSIEAEVDRIDIRFEDVEVG